MPSIGSIFRDYAGKVIMAYAAQITATSAIESVTIALLQGLKLSLTHQFHRSSLRETVQYSLIHYMQMDIYLGISCYIWKQIKNHLQKIVSWKAQLYILYVQQTNLHIFFFFTWERIVSYS